MTTRRNRMRPNRVNREAVALGSLAMGAALLIGCGGPPELENIGTEEQPIFFSGSEWVGGIIPVCFDSNLIGTDFDASIWVQTEVENTWGRYANIHFTGWGYCGAPVPNQIRITFSDIHPH